MTGRVLTALALLFLLFDSAGKLLQVQPVLDATMALGYPRSIVFPLGLVLLVCVLTSLVPRTAVLGAVLTTAYLGGAVASQLRVGNPLLSHVLFPTYVATLLWAGLILRDPRLEALLPARRRV
jgi:hypothetical protein